MTMHLYKFEMYFLPTLMMLAVLICLGMDWTIITHCIQHATVDFVDVITFTVMTVLAVFGCIGSVLSYKDLKSLSKEI
jgi:hypothetical protein